MIIARSMYRRPRITRRSLVVLAVLIVLAVPMAGIPASAAGPISFTVLHTNDFHGQLEPSGSNPGAARVANTIDTVRTAVGAANVLLFDAGDMMQGSLLSNLQQGLPTIAYYNLIGYNATTFGNHEFDWGQTVLGNRITQGETGGMEFVSANITVKDGATCDTSSWTPFNGAVEPYEVFTVGTAPDTVRVGVIAVTTQETPFITIASATAGLCFRDPAEAILHYYDALDAASDVIIVLSHIGNTDGGYGYGFPVYGDQTLAARLNTAGKPANLIIGGHSHTNLAAAQTVGNTKVVQAYYNGRRVGRADFTYDPDTGAVTVNWASLTVATTDPQYAPVQTLIAGYASDPAYQALINQPVGYAQMDLTRNTNGDAIMGDFVDDAIYGALNDDADPANDVDMFFNNPGGIRTDWCDLETSPGVWAWASTGCTMEGVWTHDPMLLTYGNMFTILPFGNATAVGTMTGAQIYEMLQQSAGATNGVIQPSGIRFKVFKYTDALPAPAINPWAWGAYDIEVFDKDSSTWLPLDLEQTYKVGTNEFLAPAGQDGFTAFKYMTNITYWGDMLNAVNAYVAAHYTFDNPYKGPDGDGTLDGRITRNGDGDYTYDPGEVVPVTILHHNDSHGRLLQSGTTPGYTNLVTAINTEMAHNPSRTLLVSGGDNIQGDSMMYYFKSAGLGYAADGSALPFGLRINPLIKAFNAVGYDAMTLGNHEFNFGTQIFSTLKQANFPILQANIEDTGAYGLAAIPVEPYTELAVGPEHISVAILGIGNHRVPSYELPSNIPGLTFTNPITTAQALAPGLAEDNDAVIALTHIGFTENPASVEVDTNVDTYFATQVAGVDAIIGAHSHTNPSIGFGAYKYLPATLAGPDNAAVLVTQAYRYNSYLGEVSPRPAARWRRRLRGRLQGRAVHLDRHGHLCRGSDHQGPDHPVQQPDHRLQRHRAGRHQRPARCPGSLHRGDQRRQPAGGRRGGRTGEQRHPGGLPPLGSHDQLQGRRHGDAGHPGHVEGLGHVQPHALRELARGHGHERPADQGGAGTGLPQLLLLQVRAGLRRLLVLHDVHAGHQLRQPDRVPGHLPGAARWRQCPGVPLRRHAHRLHRRRHLLPGVFGELPGRRRLQLQRRRGDPVAARPDRCRHAVLRAGRGDPLRRRGHAAGDRTGHRGPHRLPARWSRSPA